MNRRAFLGLLAGAVVATKLPASVLEEKGDICIRYLRAYDILRDEVIVRIDVATSELYMPPQIENAYQIKNVPHSYLSHALQTLKKHRKVDEAAVMQLEKTCRDIKPNQILGVSYPEAA